MNKKRTYILLTILLLLLFASLILYTLFGDQIALNPYGTIGNTAGNLNNGGYVCEYNGKVYFSNTYDNGSLYSMDVSEENFEKLNDVEVCNILAGGDFLYYFRSGAAGDAGLGTVRSVKSFNRCELNGANTTALTKDIIIYGQLADNYLYLLTAEAENETPLFYKLKIDKSEKVELADYAINPASVSNGIIYYNGTQSDHYLYGLNTSTDRTAEVWQGNLWYPTVDGDYIYYLDVANNYRLCRYSLSQNTEEVLTNDRVDCFNVGNGFIYYQKNSTSPCLMCMRTDGSDAQLIAEGIFTNINMTSQYVYFQEYGNDTTVYHSYLGSNFYGVFAAAKDAATANME